MPKSEAVELKEFVNSTLDAIERGADFKHRKIIGTVHFEVAVKKVFSTEAGIKVYVGKLGGSKKDENLTRVSFDIRPKVKPTVSKEKIPKVFIE